MEAGRILGIDVLDHLIVNPYEYYSIREKHSHLF
ncbi:JAB domain-containing protein [Cytobacillus firmus]|nr:JAB domain-containing protein [Cytobacillus firmus]